jgi:hypothetical protein
MSCFNLTRAGSGVCFISELTQRVLREDRRLDCSYPGIASMNDQARIAMAKPVDNRLKNRI